MNTRPLAQSNTQPGAAHRRLRLLLLFAAFASIAVLLLAFAAMTLRLGTTTALATLPTPTPTFTPVPPGDIDFSARIVASQTNAGTCDSSGVPTFHCEVQQDSTFVVGVFLKELPNDLPGGGYEGADVRLVYTGVTSPETYASVDPSKWPDCELSATAFQPGTVDTGCAVGPGAGSSSYTGLMMTAEFTCASSGVIQLAHGTGATELFQDLTAFHEPEGSAEQIEVSCVSPGAYDTDGDRCPDANEMGMNPMLGGQRNFLNPWDYFNPTLDGLNRIDDILRVVEQYYIDQGNPAYWAGTDRTGLGPNIWNLGPPNGIQRIDDILAAMGQYYHDCS